VFNHNGIRIAWVSVSIPEDIGNRFVRLLELGHDHRSQSSLWNIPNINHVFL
jgi:hypothetical protein